MCLVTGRRPAILIELATIPMKKHRTNRPCAESVLFRLSVQAIAALGGEGLQIQGALGARPNDLG